jgi:hypothetical protein
VELSQDWNVRFRASWCSYHSTIHSKVLGPFPIHAREQQYLSPSFPLNCRHEWFYIYRLTYIFLPVSDPIDLNKYWPSSYADGGKVAWSIAKADPNGSLKVSFPDVRQVFLFISYRNAVDVMASCRWESLRSTEGWAALQHHAILRTSLTVYPPASASESALAPFLLIHLSNASYFTILPSADYIERSSSAPEWYSGNIYDIERALPQIVKLPILPSLVRPTEYDIYVSGDYEVLPFSSLLKLTDLLRSGYLETQKLKASSLLYNLCDFRSKSSYRRLSTFVNHHKTLFAISSVASLLAMLLVSASVAYLGGGLS